MPESNLQQLLGPVSWSRKYCLASFFAKQKLNVAGNFGWYPVFAKQDFSVLSTFVCLQALWSLGLGPISRALLTAKFCACDHHSTLLLSVSLWGNCHWGSLQATSSRQSPRKNHSHFNVHIFFLWIVRRCLKTNLSATKVVQHAVQLVATKLLRKVASCDMALRNILSCKSTYTMVDSKWRIQNGGFKMVDSKWRIQNDGFKMVDSKWRILVRWCNLFGVNRGWGFSCFSQKWTFSDMGFFLPKCFAQRALRKILFHLLPDKSL